MTDALVTLVVVRFCKGAACDGKKGNLSQAAVWLRNHALFFFGECLGYHGRRNYSKINSPNYFIVKCNRLHKLK